MFFEVLSKNINLYIYEHLNFKELKSINPKNNLFVFSSYLYFRSTFYQAT